MTTRRDSSTPIGVAASLTATPVVPVTVQPPSVASVIDPAERMPAGLTAVTNYMWIHWVQRWSPAERERFLTVVEREFPDVTADAIHHMQRVDRRREGAV